MAGHSAVDLLNVIVDTVPAEELKQVRVTGADGTNTNTGRQEELSHYWKKNSKESVIGM